MLLEIIIIFISIVLVLYATFFGIRVYKCTKKIQRNNDKLDNKKENSKKEIIIAIPCLREQFCIEETIEYFNKIAPNIPKIIITTQKEIKENKEGKITTQEIVKEKILPKYKDVYLVNYPQEEGYMADQLNYMLENIELILKRQIDFKNTYLALYNADSRPSKNTFNEVKMKISKNYKVIQQYSYCMKNYEQLNNILKGFAIYQSNFELKTGLINTTLKTKLLYTHVLGHGLFINLETLNKLGNFNTKFWCEDIYLGLQLKINNIEIEPLVALENVETPDSLSNLIKQNSVWFKTTSQFLKIYKDIIKNKKVKNKLNGIIGTFNEFRCAINWLCFPIIICLLIIGTIIVKDYWLLLIICISYFVYILLNTIFTLKLINILDNAKYKVNIRIIINVAIATLLSNLGPLYSIIFNEKEKHKTERGNL